MDQVIGSAANTPDRPGLRQQAIGLREVLFQSITAMAPGAAIAASIPAGAAYAGGSLPLAVVLALVACLFTAIAIGELARHIPSAGSVATYTAQGLHPGVGFLVGWGYLFVELLVPPLLFLQLGFTVAATLNSQWPSVPADLWWPWVIVGSLIVLFAGYRGIRFSARLGTVLGSFEIAVFRGSCDPLRHQRRFTQRSQRLRHLAYARRVQRDHRHHRRVHLYRPRVRRFRSGSPTRRGDPESQNGTFGLPSSARRSASASSTSSPRTPSTSGSVRTSSAASPAPERTRGRAWPRPLMESSGSSSFSQW